MIHLIDLTIVKLNYQKHKDFSTFARQFRNMKKIQMVDLVSQYERIKPSIDEAILNVCSNATFINGPQVEQFKFDLEEYLNVKHVIPCANGTDALQIALMALGLKAGDEVITPSFTYIATTEVIALLGLKPVFVDVDKETFNLKIDEIEQSITDKTKAIIPVHLFGQASDMNAILSIARKHNLFVIEDNAQALGSDYHLTSGEVQKTGTLGDIGCTSFFPSKNLGCYGDGGAIFTNNPELAEKLKMISNHGQSKKYVHDLVGCNSRLDSIQASILSIKLRQLDNYIDARRKVADFYDSVLGPIQGVRIPFRSQDSKHVFHQYTIVLEEKERNDLQQYLIESKIPSMSYDPIPAHKQKMFSVFNSGELILDNTDWLTKRVISLPIHTEMNQDQLQFIGEILKNFFKK